MTRLTMFSWGYWGWGSSTRQLKQAVDAVERSRGYKPPYFVDVRLRRSGRAVGFVGTRFEKVVGKDRYRYMPSLGNESVLTKGRRIKIRDPEAAEELLDLALARSAKRQRVIFFCGCESPGTAHKPTCHRVIVSSLLLKSARKRGVNLTVVEWPGASPMRLTQKISDAEAQGLLRGYRNLGLGPKLPVPELLRLPYDSIVQFRSPNHSFYALVDHARFQAGRWLLPLPFGAEKDDDLSILRKKANRDRRETGFESQQVIRIRRSV